MAPSAQGGDTGNMTNDPWSQQNGKEATESNQRPPVFFPEDYIAALSKFNNFARSENESIYDLTPASDPGNITAAAAGASNKSRTLPLSKHSEYKSPIAPADAEMTLKQFGSITELLTKLRADLRQSFQSFVVEFTSTPMDGVSLLLEVLRAIQLSQNTITGSSTLNSQNLELRNNQTYQRRALLDELACLQCLSICCSRSTEAASRLGTTPVGLLPLSCSATGTGIRARILALQLLTFACDKHSLNGPHHAPKASLSGHQAVSEALATLRLRCAEPVRFRLLIGILNSGGGSGELQYAGMRFINTFMESADSLQTRLYLQAELSTAGLDPQQMSKLISPTSPWQAKLNDEVKRWEAIKIDVEKLQKEVRSAEHCRSKLVILERKVEMLQDEKNVFTSIERRLQEKCAELQREMMQLKKSQSASSTLEKRPVALPRQTLVGTNTLKKNSSENEDEGISSSETGQSSSPVPPHDYHNVEKKKSSRNKSSSFATTEDDDSNTTIDDVIEELTNIVNDAEREISENNTLSVNIKSSGLKKSNSGCSGMEKEIVVNLLPQPPKKASKSLVQILGPQHDDADYDLYYVDEPLPAPQKPQHHEESPYENDYEMEIDDQRHHHNHPDIINTTTQARRSNSDDNNRQLLNVIMDAREREQQKINAAVAKMSRAHSLERDIVPQQQFSGGVFFMSNNMMNNHHSRFSKPDIMTATSKQQRSLGGSKNFASVDSMIDVVMSSTATTAVVGNSIELSKQTTKSRAIFLPTTAVGEKFSSSHNIAFNNFKFKNTNVNPSLFEQQPHGRESRSQSNNGSKVTDLISGLY